MTLAADIRSACAGAVTALSDSGWMWAARTSAWDAAPAYGTAVALPVLATQYSQVIGQADSDETVSHSVMVRVADDGSSSMPMIGDKLTNAAGIDFVVTQLVSAAYGSRRYMAEAGVRLTIGPQRGRVS